MKYVVFFEEEKDYIKYVDDAVKESWTTTDINEARIFSSKKEVEEYLTNNVIIPSHWFIDYKDFSTSHPHILKRVK